MSRITILLSTLAVGAAIGLSLVGAEPPARAQAREGLCPDRLVAGQASLLCYCPSDATANGGVWGSDVYTDDSHICRAALHAGMIGTDGGMVWVGEQPGQASYPAVNRNSVASTAWGAWTRSIAFRPASEAGEDDGLRACPTTAASLALGDQLHCGCTAEAVGAGSVWGSGPYTGDSSICRSARHAGLIGAGGGAVRVRIVAGRDGYTGSQRNGISSSNWGSYGTSFEVAR